MSSCKKKTCNLPPLPGSRWCDGHTAERELEAAVLRQRGLVPDPEGFAADYWGSDRPVVHPGGHTTLWGGASTRSGVSAWRPPAPIGKPCEAETCTLMASHAGHHLKSGLCHDHYLQTTMRASRISSMPPGRHQGQVLGFGPAA